MIFLKSFSLLFRTGPLHQRRVLSYHTAFFVSTGFLCVFFNGVLLVRCVMMTDIASPPRKRKRFLAPFYVTMASTLHKAGSSSR